MKTPQTIMGKLDRLKKDRALLQLLFNSVAAAKGLSSKRNGLQLTIVCFGGVGLALGLQSYKKNTKIKINRYSQKGDHPRTNYTTSKSMKIFFFVCLSMSIRLITPLLVLALLQLGLGCLQLTVIPQTQRVCFWCQSGRYFVTPLDTVNTIQPSVSLCLCRCK